MEAEKIWEAADFLRQANYVIFSYFPASFQLQRRIYLMADGVLASPIRGGLAFNLK